MPAPFTRATPATGHLSAYACGGKGRGTPVRVEERRVAIGDLATGMYVCRLEREGNWEGTPFLLQGLMVESPEDIDQLARYCTHVYVDIEMGRAPIQRLELQTLAPRGPRAGYSPPEIDRLFGSVSHRDTAAFDEELPRAREAQGTVAEFASRMLQDVREGRSISAENVRGAVEPMVRSILRNADAFLWIDTLRERGSYEYNHALGCSALAAAFGRHVGFPEDLLADMAGGGLLLDIGKLRVRQELLNRKGKLAPSEVAELRGHVDHGLAVVEEGGKVLSHVRDMILFHHEREDGSGYPQGLEGDHIPLLARIAGLIDTYDAMISERPWRGAMGRHAALQLLYRERGKQFGAELIEQFLLCLGVYPTGSLVELSTGEVAMVMGQNPARRLRPKLMLLTDPAKVLLPSFRTLDLMAQAERDDSAVQITMALEAGAYGLDAEELYL